TMTAAPTTTPRPSRARRALLAILAAGLSLAALPVVGLTSGHAITAAPHIMVIVEENEGYSSIIGNSSGAPFINGTLVPHSRVATNWSGLTNISLADYVALISGTKSSYSAPTLVGELASAGITWKSYFQSMPSACYTGS